MSGREGGGPWLDALMEGIFSFCCCLGCGLLLKRPLRFCWIRTLLLGLDPY